MAKVGTPPGEDIEDQSEHITRLSDKPDVKPRTGYSDHPKPDETLMKHSEVRVKDHDISLASYRNILADVHARTFSDPGHPPRRSERQRQLTQKGQSFMLETKEQRLNLIFRRLDRMSEDIYALMDRRYGTREVQAVFSKWVSLYDELLTVYNDTCNLEFDPVSLQKFKMTFQNKHEPLVVFREDINEWFLSRGSRDEQSYSVNGNEFKNAIAPSMRGSDGSSHESKSMKSVSKSSSSKHSLLSARLRENQKQAELVAREEALTKKQALEDSKMKILQQQEALAIKTELEVSKARSKVLEQFEEDSNPSQRNIIDKPSTHHQQRSNPAYEFNVPILQDDSSSMISRISESRSPIVLQRKRDFEVHEVQAASKYQSPTADHF